MTALWVNHRGGWDAKSLEPGAMRPQKHVFRQKHDPLYLQPQLSDGKWAFAGRTTETQSLNRAAVVVVLRKSDLTSSQLCF